VAGYERPNRGLLILCGRVAVPILLVAVITVACTDATSPRLRVLDGPIVLALNGTFDVAGTFTGAGNAFNADHTPHAVRYAGRASREVVRLIITGAGFGGGDTVVAVPNGPRYVAAC
jgi:hypothetical protein